MASDDFALIVAELETRMLVPPQVGRSRERGLARKPPQVGQSRKRVLAREAQ